MSAAHPYSSVPAPRPGQATAVAVLGLMGSCGAAVGLLLLVIALGDAEFATDFAERAGVDAGDTGTLVDIMRTAAGWGIALALAAVVATVLFLQRRPAARVVLTVTASLGILTSLVFFPIGLLWTGVCIAALVLMWQSPVSLWLRGSAAR